MLVEPISGFSPTVIFPLPNLPRPDVSPMEPSAVTSPTLSPLTDFLANDMLVTTNTLLSASQQLNLDLQAIAENLQNQAKLLSTVPADQFDAFALYLQQQQRTLRLESLPGLVVNIYV